MSRTQPISRRTMLRGLGVTMALPLLDAMVPGGGTLARAAGAAGLPASAGGATAAPVRMAMFFIPNGVNMDHWRPGSAGALGDLPPSLQPLAKVKDDLTVLSGLALENAKALGDGPGDHARSAAAFLTGAHPRKTAGSDIRNGVSLDQLAAEKIGGQTKLRSLELGLDKTQLAGDCDSGYACAYVDNISWRSESTPMPKEVDPAAVFDRLFGAENERQAAEGRKKRANYRKSVLDFVADDAKRLERKLGSGDRNKLDEFTTSVREIERRIELARKEQSQSKPIDPGIDRPEGIPGEMTDHMRLMADLLALAFQTDMTRVSTFMVARDGGNRAYRWLGVSEGHHSLSHHGRRKENIEQIRKIDRYHVEQFAYFLERLKGIREGDGTLLDHCMVMMGSGISDGDRHNHNDLPVLLAGKGGGAITPGRHVTYDRDTPLCNLYLSMLDAAGAKGVERFGDSTGRLKGLKA